VFAVTAVLVVVALVVLIRRSRRKKIVAEAQAGGYKELNHGA